MSSTKHMDEPHIKADEKEVSKEEEYLNNWKRAQADLINYKKDEARRIEEVVKFGTQGVIMDVLDALDNLELSAKHIDDKGLQITIKQFASLLKKYGVERIAVAGQQFDPAVHEAVAEIDESKPLAEVRAGYTLYGKVIRPARVQNG